jgi:hypothetical protein
MKLIFRLLLTLVVVVGTFYFIYWVSAAFTEVMWLAFAIAITCAIAAGWFIWSQTRSASRKLGMSVIYGAIVVGAIGFAAGFFGPILFAPEANQGPLLGIFITGPLGVVVGAIGGLIYGLTRRREPRGFPVVGPGKTSASARV